MSLTLYLDTGGNVSTVAIFKEQCLLSSRENPVLKSHNAFIHQHIDEILQENSLEFQGITEVWVMNGPGSYTGLRTGLSVAKGICYGLNIPLFLISRFDGLYYSQHQTDVLILFHARANEYFFCSYENGKPTGSPELWLEEDILNLVKSASIKVISDKTLEINGIPMEIVKPDLHRIAELSGAETKVQFQADLMTSEPFYYKNVHFGQ